MRLKALMVLLLACLLPATAVAGAVPTIDSVALNTCDATHEFTGAINTAVISDVTDNGSTATITMSSGFSTAPLLYEAVYITGTGLPALDGKWHNTTTEGTTTSITINTDPEGTASSGLARIRAYSTRQCSGRGPVFFYPYALKTVEKRGSTADNDGGNYNGREASAAVTDFVASNRSAIWMNLSTAAGGSTIGPLDNGTSHNADRTFCRNSSSPYEPKYGAGTQSWTVNAINDVSNAYVVIRRCCTDSSCGTTEACPTNVDTKAHFESYKALRVEAYTGCTTDTGASIQVHGTLPFAVDANDQLERKLADGLHNSTFGARLDAGRFLTYTVADALLASGARKAPLSTNGGAEASCAGWQTGGDYDGTIKPAYRARETTGWVGSTPILVKGPGGCTFSSSGGTSNSQAEWSNGIAVSPGEAMCCQAAIRSAKTAGAVKMYVYDKATGTDFDWDSYWDGPWTSPAWPDSTPLTNGTVPVAHRPTADVIKTCGIVPDGVTSLGMRVGYGQASPLQTTFAVADAGCVRGTTVAALKEYVIPRGASVTIAHYCDSHCADDTNHDIPNAIDYMQPFVRPDLRLQQTVASTGYSVAGEQLWETVDDANFKAVRNAGYDYAIMVLGGNDVLGSCQPFTTVNGVPPNLPHRSWAARKDIRTILDEFASHGTRVFLWGIGMTCAGYDNTKLTAETGCSPESNCKGKPGVDAYRQLDQMNFEYMDEAFSSAIDPSEMPQCSDGLDNDGDGFIDLDDPGCAAPESDTENPQCNDGVDNDGDGLVDYPDDPECVAASGPTEAQCNDGVDNDGDGFVDLEDPGCEGSNDPSEMPQCSDGLDNDGDGFVDLDDPGCPFPESTPENPQCDDGLDNDGDGLVDSADPQCSAAWPYRESAPGRSCGFGAELALLVPPLAGLRRRKGRRSRIDPTEPK